MKETKIIHNCKAFVISLESQKERLDNFYKKYNQYDNFCLQKAIYGKELYPRIDDYFDIPSFKEIYNRIPAPGEIGCTLSHLEVYKRVALDDSIKDEDFIIVAEDDAILHPDWYHKVDNLIFNIVNRPEIELVLFNYHKNRSFNYYDHNPISSLKQYQLEGDDLYIFRIVKQQAIGSVFYIIRKSSINKILLFLGNNKPYWLADDFHLLIGNGYKTGILLTNPLLSYTSEVDSTIEDDRKKSRREARKEFKKKYQDVYKPSKKEIILARELDKKIFAGLELVPNNIIKKIKKDTKQGVFYLVSRFIVRIFNKVVKR